MTLIGNTQFGINSVGTGDIIGGATNDGHGILRPEPTGQLDLRQLYRRSFEWLGCRRRRQPGRPQCDRNRTARPGRWRRRQRRGRSQHHWRPEANDRNVITGENQELDIGAVGDVQVLNNYFGTDITGTIGLDHIGQGAGGWNAISISDAGPNIVIGAPGAGNVIGDDWPSPYPNSFAVFVQGAGPGLLIQGNKIGTNAAGTAAIPNGSGIYIDDVTGFLIGGTAAGAGNLISGNVAGAITIGSTSGGSIEGNDIGTDVTGTLAIPNATEDPSEYGIVLGNGASNVTIGGTTVAARNIISGNDGDGILISDAVIDIYGNGVPFNDGVNEDNTVEGNFIGINANGVASPNLGSGIVVATTALDTVVGGTAQAAGNVISGNASNGVGIDGTGVPAETPL